MHSKPDQPLQKQPTTRPILHKFSLLLFTIALTTCPLLLTPHLQATPPGKNKKAKHKDQHTNQLTTPRDTFTSLRYLTRATYALLTEEFRLAKHYLFRAIEKDPQNSAAYYLLGLLSLQKMDAETAQNYLEHATRYHPSNQWYWYVYASVCEILNTPTCARQGYQQAFYLDTTNLFFARAYLRFLAKQKDWKEAEHVLQILEHQPKYRTEALRWQARILAQQGKIQEARTVLITLLQESHSNREKIFHELLQTLFRNQNFDLANQFLHQWLAEDSTNLNALTWGICLAYQQKDTQHLYHYFLRILRHPDLLFRDKLLYLVGYHPRLGKVCQTSTDPITEWEDEPNLTNTPTSQQSRLAQTQIFTLSLLDSARLVQLLNLFTQFYAQEFNAWAIAGDLLHEQQLPYAAIHYYLRALAMDSTSPRLWQQIISVYAETEQWQEARQAVEAALEYFPNHVLFHWFGAYICYRQGSYLCASQYAQHGLALLAYLENTEEVRRDLEQIWAEAAHHLGNYRISDSLFQKLIREEPDNPIILNNYAYFLALRKERLRYARKLIRKAIRLQKNVPSFEDTYGWVYFQMGKVKKAKTWIERAIQHGGDSPDIYDHYGDILYELGQCQQAIHWWQKAIDRLPNHQQKQRATIQEKIERAKTSKCP